MVMGRLGYERNHHQENHKESKPMPCKFSWKIILFKFFYINYYIFSFTFTSLLIKFYIFSSMATFLLHWPVCNPTRNYSGFWISHHIILTKDNTGEFLSYLSSKNLCYRRETLVDECINTSAHKTSTTI